MNPSNLKNVISGARAALIDMDGVLYDSMKYHTLVWQQVMCELGILCTREEFYLYEGMTGRNTIRMLWRKHFGKDISFEDCDRIYARKSFLFTKIGRKEPMPGADRMLRTLQEAGIRRVLVTGSGQGSILDSINTDYPGAFLPGDRVTSLDVVHGKPDPEPYLKGLAISGADKQQAIVIENAPLGVRAGKAAGLFTIAVTTGPIPRAAFEQEGADLIFSSMPEFAEALAAAVSRNVL